MLNAVTAILAAVTITLELMILLDKLGVAGTGAFWYGADFIPAYWLALPAILVGLRLIALKNRRYFAGWLAIYVIFFLGFGDYSLKSVFPKTETAGGAKLKVGALNVQYYSHGLETVIDSIKKMNADVMFLSENVLNKEQQAKIPSLLKGLYFFQGHPNSTAIISKYPLYNSREISLPSIEASLCDGNDLDTMPAGLNRSFVYSAINLNGKTVHLISVRFIAGRPKNKTVKEQLRWGKYLVETQLRESRFFTTFLKTLNGPVIFGGDLNAPPGSKTMSLINRMADDAYLSDHVLGIPTFRTSFPTLRLDYLFGMNGAKPLNSKIVDMEVSDHFPIISDFVITEKLQTAAK